MNTKKFTIGLFLLFLTISINAQDMMMEISGVVIDEEGAPLPGALIETAGGVNSTETQDDGTFTMEVSRYLTEITVKSAGMFDKKIKLKGKDTKKLIIEMEEDLFYSPKGLKGNMVIRGSVIDRYGNLLSGAKIEVAKQNISTVSDADGTFSIEIPRSTEFFTVIYPGLGKKKVHPKGRNNKPFIVKLR